MTAIPPQVFYGGEGRMAVSRNCCTRAACCNRGTSSKTVRWKRPCSRGARRMAFGLLMDSQAEVLGACKTGAISRVGDAMVRTALYEAAHIMLSRVTRFSSLKRWALDVARRRGLKRAKVALARKLATDLHRMWIDVASFRWGKQAVAAV